MRPSRPQGYNQYGASSWTAPGSGGMFHGNHQQGNWGETGGLISHRPHRPAGSFNPRYGAQNGRPRPQAGQGNWQTPQRQRAPAPYQNAQKRPAQTPPAAPSAKALALEANRKAKDMYPAPPPTSGPLTLETVGKRVEELEKSFIMFRQCFAQVHRLFGEVDKIKNELASPASTGLSAPKPTKAKTPAAPEFPFKSCVVPFWVNECLFVPMNSEEGQLIIVGQKPIVIKPEQYFVHNRPRISFQDMTTVKVCCEIAQIEFEDGTIETYLMGVWEGEQDPLAPTMRMMGMDGKIRIDGPEKAAVRYFRRKESNFFDLEPKNYLLNGQPLTTFDEIDEKQYTKFVPDLEALYNEKKFVAKVAWNKMRYPYELVTEEGCLVEFKGVISTHKINCRILSGKFQGCMGRLTEGVEKLEAFDILRCDIRISDDSTLDVINAVVVPTKKVPAVVA